MVAYKSANTLLAFQNPGLLSICLCCKGFSGLGHFNICSPPQNTPLDLRNMTFMDLVQLTRVNMVS